MAWAPDYIDTDALATFQRIGDTVDDVELALAITAASRAIDDHTNRQFGQVEVPELRRYTARVDWGRSSQGSWGINQGAWVIDIDDLDDAADLVVTVPVNGVDTAITSYTLEPVNAVAKGMVWTRLVVDPASTVQPTGDPNEVSATALWGWSTTPLAVTLASRLQASRFSSRRDSPYGVAGSPDLGSELRLLSKLDPDVAVSLRGLVRSRRVA